MSEFRKYRAVSKLLDSFGNVNAPQKYVSVLAKDEPEHAHVPDAMYLMKHAQDPIRFREILTRLRTESPDEAGKVLRLLQCLVEGKASDVPIQSIVTGSSQADAAAIKGGAARTEPALEEIKPRFERIKISQNGSDDFELDELARRLSKTQHRLGTFDSRDPQTDSSQEGRAQVRVRTFRNDFEWSAGQFPLPLQEIFIIEDLLYLLLGLSGRYLCREEGESDPWGFLIDDTVSGTILETIQPVLRASCCFEYLEGFARRRCSFADGRVCQALSATIQSLLQEFRQVVVLLEKKFSTGSLGLQQFVFHLQPYVRNLQAIHDVVMAVEQRRLRGGSILVELERGVAQYAGDKVIRALLEEVLVKCSVPFLAMMATWIQDGSLEDPCNEFFIRPRNELDPSPANGSHSFASAFVLVDANIPAMLQPSVGKILQIGAYHNILRGYAADPEDYSGDASIASDGALAYDQRKNAAVVDRAFESVNRRMLMELVAGDRLISSLRLCKSYYFAENCDLLHSFLDANRSELDKPAPAVIVDHIQTGWENALRSFSPYVEGKHHVECYQADLTLTDQLQRIMALSDPSRARATEIGQVRGLDLLSIRIKFDFPDTLIFDAENLAKYELLFRYILRLVDFSRELSRSDDFGGASKGLQKSLLILRRQMLHFVENLHQYLAYEVIEPQWEALAKAIPAATGMDSIVKLHTQFIDACLRQAMLTNAKLVQIANVLFTQCQRLLSICAEGLGSVDAPAKLAAVQSAFNKAMRMFLEALQYYSSRDYDYHLGTLFSRLDYSSFYYATSFGADGAIALPNGEVGDRRTTFGTSAL